MFAVGTDFKNLKEFVSAAEKMKNKKKDFTEKLESKMTSYQIVCYIYSISFQKLYIFSSFLNIC